MFLFAGCRKATQITLPATKPSFTKANIWYEQPKIWSSNFKTGAILPAGTKITTIILHKGRRQALQFTTADNKTFWLFLAPKFDPGLHIEDIQKRLFGDKNLQALSRGLTAAEVTSIKQGRITKGMSKAAVLVSWGYPPTALTPSTKADKWTYWKSRFDKQDVFFDAKGRVADIVD